MRDTSSLHVPGDGGNPWQHPPHLGRRCNTWRGARLKGECAPARVHGGQTWRDANEINGFTSTYRTGAARATESEGALCATGNIEVQHMKTRLRAAQHATYRMQGVSHASGHVSWTTDGPGNERTAWTAL
eukprot:scaffold162315_cov36-Tisochrysis_lutea.AAC.1